MDIYEAIANRKTIRDFSDREIPMELAKKLISAGIQAPSNDHFRHWHFLFLQDRIKRQELLTRVIHPISQKGAVGIVNRWQMTEEIQREMYLDAIPKQFNMLNNAALLILPCFQQTKPLLKPKDLSALNPFASIWCCIENVLLAAAAEGIFGVTRIPGETERKTLQQELNIPQEYEIPCYLALGYPAENAIRARQIEFILEDRIHPNSW